MIIIIKKMENKYNIKQGDFVTILSPMVQRLNLSGNNLLVFALIHGFSKDEDHTFRGSINYIACWLNISRNSVIDTLKVLVEANYILKEVEYKNAVKFCIYRSNYDELIKKLDSGCEIAPLVAKTRKGGAKMQKGSCKNEPNNYIYIDKDKDIYKEDIDKSISKKVFENFRNSYQGTKRGLEVEFKNFTKHKDWKEVLPLLGKALEREITHRNNLLANNQFCPCWAHLSTWINQRRWEQEFESVESQQKEKDIVKPTLNMKF